jgi:hypothetical protein
MQDAEKKGQEHSTIEVSELCGSEIANQKPIGRFSSEGGL